MFYPGIVLVEWFYILTYDSSEHYGSKTPSRYGQLQTTLDLLRPNLWESAK